MKRIITCIITFLYIAATLVSCAESPKETAPATDQKSTAETAVETKEKVSSIDGYNVGEGGELIKIALAKGEKAPSTKYMQFGDGIIYSSPSDDGYLCGYFDLSNSILNEMLTETEKTDIRCFHESGLKGYVAADGKLSLIDAASGILQSAGIPEDARLDRAILDSSTTIIYENEKYILTSTVDFDKQYVLAEKSSLSDFGEIISASEDGKRIYYAMKSDNEKYSGYAYTEYAKSETLGKHEIGFSDFTVLKGEKVLFYDCADGKQIYTLCDLKTGDTKTYENPASFFAYGSSVARDGSILALYSSESGDFKGGRIDIIDLARGERTARYTLEDETVNPSIVLSADGKAVFYGTLDEKTDPDVLTESESRDRDGELIHFIRIK